MISVIVPVYNVERTLDRCIQSILKQTFKDFEIILVNDGSTDKSGNICDEYAIKYSNIRVIHKENEGLGPTRNRGIVESKGEYIYHCDSDDWIREDLLEKAYNSIVETNADVVFFGYQIFTEEDNKIIPYKTVHIEKNTIVESKQIKKLFIEHFFTSFVMMSACNRLYKKSFLVDNNLFFPALRRSQDMAYSFMLFNELKKISLIDEEFYCYIIQPGVFKGRSYDEMIEIYYQIYQSAKDTFTGWGEYNADTKNKLINYVCEQVANYSAYAFAVKYKQDWKQNTKKLISNKQLRELFIKYKNVKKSKFMHFFCLGIKIKSKNILFFISKFMQRKVEKS